MLLLMPVSERETKRERKCELIIKMKLREAEKMKTSGAKES